MSTTFKSAFRRTNRDKYKTPVHERHISIDDEMADADIERCQWEQGLNGNGSHPERYCSCRELIVNDKRVPYPPGHDCAYVAQRSALVSDAERDALRMPGRFMKNFCTLMERRAAPLLDGAADH